MIWIRKRIDFFLLKFYFNILFLIFKILVLVMKINNIYIYIFQKWQEGTKKFNLQWLLKAENIEK